MSGTARRFARLSAGRPRSLCADRIPAARAACDRRTRAADVGPPIAISVADVDEIRLFALDRSSTDSPDRLPRKDIDDAAFSVDREGHLRLADPSRRDLRRRQPSPRASLRAERLRGDRGHRRAIGRSCQGSHRGLRRRAESSREVRSRARPCVGSARRSSETRRLSWRHPVGEGRFLIRIERKAAPSRWSSTN